MSSKSTAIEGNMVCGSHSEILSGKVITGTVLFIAAFVILAYVLGHADVVTNPYSPARILM